MNDHALIPEVIYLKYFIIASLFTYIAKHYPPFSGKVCLDNFLLTLPDGNSFLKVKLDENCEL